MYAQTNLSTPHNNKHSSLAQVIVIGPSLTSSHLLAAPQDGPFQQVLTSHLAVLNIVAKAFALLPAYHRVHTKVF